VCELDWILVLRLEKVLCADAVYGDDTRADHNPVVLLACEISPPVHLTRVLPCKTNYEKFYQCCNKVELSATFHIVLLFNPHYADTQKQRG
jgi:hypothetical protein